MTRFGYKKPLPSEKHWPWLPVPQRFTWTLGVLQYCCTDGPLRTNNVDGLYTVTLLVPLLNTKSLLIIQVYQIALPIYLCCKQWAQLFVHNRSNENFCTVVSNNQPARSQYLCESWYVYAMIPAVLLYCSTLAVFLHCCTQWPWQYVSTIVHNKYGSTYVLLYILTWQCFCTEFTIWPW